MRSKPRAILITGASKRLGFAFVKESLDLGYRVIAHYHSSRQPLETWLQHHPALKRRVYWIEGDLRNEPAHVIDAVTALPVRLVGLVNNAAIFTKGNLLDLDHFRETISTNFLAPLTLASRFAANVTSGWIINLTDAHIGPFNAGYQNYRFSKKMVEELTRQLARLLAPAIRVNAIAPGAMLPAKGDTAAAFAALKKNIPLGTTGDIEGLRSAFRFLITNRSLTGQTIYVDGGWHLCD
jgi:pteridine reductase